MGAFPSHIVSAYEIKRYITTAQSKNIDPDLINSFLDSFPYSLNYVIGTDEITGKVTYYIKKRNQYQERINKTVYNVHNGATYKKPVKCNDEFDIRSCISCEFLLYEEIGLTNEQFDLYVQIVNSVLKS